MESLIARRGHAVAFEMCAYCVVTLGGFVGAVALAKSGGLGGARAALWGLISRVGGFRR